MPKSEYRAAEKPDLRNSPMPRFDLLKVDRYHALTIQFARGCPFNCEFCDIITMYGREAADEVAVEQVMSEIRECHRLGLASDLRRRRQLHRQQEDRQAAAARNGALRARERLSVDFNTEVSIDVALDDELLNLLREANFTTLFIGIETPRVEPA